MNEKQRDNANAWIEMFTQLGTNGVPSLDQLEQIAASDVRFRDPFNDVTGRPAIQKLLEHTLSQIPDVRFEILDTACSGQRTYLKWRMTGTIRLLGVWRVEGMSELMFDEYGLLLAHQDYWDASEHFYARLPVIGRVLRWVRSSASVSQKTN